MALLNREKFITDILIQDFKGNQTQCADELGISRGYLHEFLYNDKRNPGHKLINAIYEYCLRKEKSMEGLFAPYSISSNQKNS